MINGDLAAFALFPYFLKCKICRTRRPQDIREYHWKYSGVEALGNERIYRQEENQQDEIGCIIREQAFLP